jgi:hypothetical protein
MVSRPSAPPSATTPLRPRSPQSALHLDERLTAYPRLPLVAAREWAEVFTPAAVEMSSAAEEGREQDRSGSKALRTGWTQYPG